MENFVSFELAKKLKEKGFKEKCLTHFDHHNCLYWARAYVYDVSVDTLAKSCNEELEHVIDAPTISQVLKWLRDEKKKHVVINIWGRTWGYDVLDLPSGRSLHWTAYNENINSYEQAAIAGIEYVIDNLI